MIAIRKVTHRYGAVQALFDLSFEVRAGSLVGLIGPNGAGKSTLIRAIATLLRPSEGFIRVGDYDTVTQAARVRSILGFLPERASPYPELTAREHLDLFARIAGYRGADLERVVEESLDGAGLAERWDTPCAELSKGLKQRLALQACLLHDPPALVLDEPTDGLDPDSREGLLRVVRERADHGTAVLLSSHVLAELEEYADEVIILSKGRLAEQHEEHGASIWVLGLRDNAARAEVLLASQPGVMGLRRVSEQLHFSLAPELPDPAELVALLVREGFPLVELHRVEERLRDRYRAAISDQPESAEHEKGGDLPLKPEVSS